MCIRTLGTAGDKFVKEIQSINRQTVRPDRILVYIPHGYDLPEPFEGSESITYVRCDKGMVTQRSLPFDEVKTPLILFLDDDIELRNDSVETLLRELNEHDGDCIVANVFANHEMSWKQRIMAALMAQTFPAFDGKWAFKIRRNAHYSYQSSPQPVMKSQSGAGPCSLMKKSIYDAIDFKEERWIEHMGFPLGEDLLMFNKIYQGGGNLLVSYDCGAVHLSAKSGHIKNPKQADYSKKFLWYLLWHRTCYSTAATKWERLLRIVSFYSNWAYCVVADAVYAAIRRAPYKPVNRVKALIASRKFARSPEFQNLKPFKINLKNS